MSSLLGEGGTSAEVAEAWSRVTSVPREETEDATGDDGAEDVPDDDVSACAALASVGVDEDMLIYRERRRMDELRIRILQISELPAYEPWVGSGDSTRMRSVAWEYEEPGL